MQSPTKEEKLQQRRGGRDTSLIAAEKRQRRGPETLRFVMTSSSWSKQQPRSAPSRSSRNKQGGQAAGRCVLANAVAVEEDGAAVEGDRSRGAVDQDADKLTAEGDHGALDEALGAEAEAYG